MRISAPSTSSAALGAVIVAVGAASTVAAGASAAAASTTGPAAGGGTRGTGLVSTAATLAVAPAVRVREGICTTLPAYRLLAAKLSADIQTALRGWCTGT